MPVNGFWGTFAAGWIFIGGIWIIVEEKPTYRNMAASAVASMMITIPARANKLFEED